MMISWKASQTGGDWIVSTENRASQKGTQKAIIKKLSLSSRIIESWRALTNIVGTGDWNIGGSMSSQQRQEPIRQLITAGQARAGFT